MQGRVVAFILIGSGLAVGAVGLAVLALFAGAAGLSAAGFGVGVILLLIITLPLLGAGIFLLMKSAQEGKEEEIVAKQRKILDAVQARGQIRLSDLVMELKSSKEQVQNWVYNLVGMGLFSGYIDWDEGLLYSIQASHLKNLTECKKCGGKVTLAGKGVSKCQYCGTEYFL